MGRGEKRIGEKEGRGEERRATGREEKTSKGEQLLVQRVPRDKLRKLYRIDKQKKLWMNFEVCQDRDTGAADVVGLDGIGLDADANGKDRMFQRTRMGCGANGKLEDADRIGWMRWMRCHVTRYNATGWYGTVQYVMPCYIIDARARFKKVEERRDS